MHVQLLQLSLGKYVQFQEYVMLVVDIYSDKYTLHNIFAVI